MTFKFHWPNTLNPISMFGLLLSLLRCMMRDRSQLVSLYNNQIIK